MGTCNNQQQSINTMKARGCTRKIGATDMITISKGDIEGGGSSSSSSPCGPPAAKKRRILVETASSEQQQQSTATTTTTTTTLPKNSNSNTHTNNNDSDVDVDDASLGKTITELNRQAIHLYNMGEFGTASTLFRKAVALRWEEPWADSTTTTTLTTPTTMASASDDTTSTSEPATSSSSSTDSLEEDTKERTSRPACGIPPPSSYIYQRMDFDEGMNVYAETISIQADDDHPDAVEATLFFNAGQARRKLNDMEGASELYDRALKTFGSIKQVKTIRTVHSIILPILHNIGQLTYCNGNLDEAVAIYEVALRHAREIHGEKDISVGLTLNCLGVLCYHLSTDRSDRAKIYFEQALEIQNQVLGEDSFASATTHNNLGRIHVQREDFATALTHYEKSLETRRRLGTEHIDYAASAFNAGQGYHQLGQLDKALGLYQQFLSVAVKKFSRNHRDVAVVLSGMAQIYQEKKDITKALELYKESLVVGRAALGNSHSEVAMLLNRLGNFHFDRGQFQEALNVYLEGLHIERKVLPENHQNIIITLSNVAEIYRQKNDPKAIKLYNEVLGMQRKCYGESSVEVASTLNVLGLIHDLQGNTRMALKCLQEALVIRRTTLGDNHLDLSATLIYLGTIFYRRGATSMALQLFMESLRIRIDNHGREHRDVSFAMYNCALCFQMQGSYREAIRCYRETLRIERLVLGEKHKDVSMTVFKLGEVYAANNETDRALESFQTSLKIEQGLEKEADPTTVARILNEIANIYNATGKTQLMMMNLIEAARVLKRAGLPPYDGLSLPDRLYAFGISCPSSASAA